MREANTAVSALKKITEDIERSYTNIDDITSSFLSVDTEIIDSG
jgi:hypothetical protein